MMDTLQVVHSGQLQAELRELQRTVARLLQALAVLDGRARITAYTRVVTVLQTAGPVELLPARSSRVRLLVSKGSGLIGTLQLSSQPPAPGTGAMIGHDVDVGQPFLDEWPLCHKGPWFAQAVDGDVMVAVTEWLVEDEEG